MIRHIIEENKGSILGIALIYFVVFTITGLGLLTFATSSGRTSRRKFMPPGISTRSSLF